ncbi:MAG: hypothetical protein ACFB20_12280 [Opitutales bacterium]
MNAAGEGFVRQRPWIWLVALFGLLILGWGVFFKLALDNPAQEVELGESLPMPDATADATLPEAHATNGD